MNCLRTKNSIRAFLSFVLIICNVPSAIGGEPKSDDSFFAVDKLKHFSVSMFLSGGTGFIANNHFGASRKESVLIGFSASIGVGGLKEMIDISTGTGTPSWKDFAVDILGSLAGAAIVAGVTK